MMRFLRGYGASIEASMAGVRVGVVSEVVGAYGRKIYRLIGSLVIFGSLLPLMIRLYSYKFGDIDTLWVRGLFLNLSTVCASREVSDVFCVWYLCMVSSAVVVVVLAVKNFPYRSIGELVRRAPTVGKHLLATAVSLVLSLLVLLIVSGSSGFCAYDKQSGHAALVLGAATSSIAGMAVFGSAIWLLSVTIWLSAILLTFVLVARFFVRSN